MVKHAKFKKNLKEFAFYLLILVILMISGFNIKTYFSPKKILGISTTIDKPKSIFFWHEFLKQNPDYIPGWIALGNIERVNQIDPNYFSSTR